MLNFVYFMVNPQCSTICHFMNLNDTSRFTVVNWIPARCPTGPNKWPNSLIMVVTNDDEEDGNHIVVDCNEI